MKKGESRRQGGWLDGRFAEFDRRLKGILGEKRIPRHEKEAKAEQALQAVDDLIEGITADISQIEK